MRHAVIFGEQFGPGTQAASDLVENRARESLRHFLREHGRDEPLLPGDFALRRLDFALDQPQEGALARSVAAQQADPLPRLQREVGLIQQQWAAKAQTDVAQRNECHSLMIWVAVRSGKTNQQVLYPGRPKTPPQDNPPAAGYTTRATSGAGFLHRPNAAFSACHL